MDLGSKKRAAEDQLPERCKKRNKAPSTTGLVTWNMQGRSAGAGVGSPWYVIQRWFANPREQSDAHPYQPVVACVQEGGTPPATFSLLETHEVDANEDLTLYKYKWEAGTLTRARKTLYLLFCFPGGRRGRSGREGGRVNHGIISDTEFSMPGDVKYVPGEERPLVGLKYRDMWLFSIHASSGDRRKDAPDLVRDVYSDEQVRGAPWWVVGDFNRPPLASDVQDPSRSLESAPFRPGPRGLL